MNTDERCVRCDLPVAVPGRFIAAYTLGELPICENCVTALDTAATVVWGAAELLGRIKENSPIWRSLTADIREQIDDLLPELRQLEQTLNLSEVLNEPNEEDPES
jgi:hypothetical protein